MGASADYKPALNGEQDKRRSVDAWSEKPVRHRRPRLHRLPDQRSRHRANWTSCQVPGFVNVAGQQQGRRRVRRFCERVRAPFKEPQAQHVQPCICSNLDREQSVPAQRGYKRKPFNDCRPPVVRCNHQRGHSVCINLLRVCTACQQALSNGEKSSVARFVQWRCTVVNPGTTQRSRVTKNCARQDHVRDKVDVSTCCCCVQW